LVLAVFGLSLFTPLQRAQATSVSGITLNDAHPTVKADYGPIPGNNPAAGNVADPTTSDCNTLPTEDLIQIDISFTQQFGVLDTFSVGWTSPQNDIDVYFFDGNGNEIGKAADSNNPEVVRLGNLANGTYYECVVNFSGANTGFTLTASRQFLHLYKYTPPPQTPFPTVAAPASSAPPPATSAPAPSPRVLAAGSAEPVVTPGPNGPGAPQSLLTVGHQAAISKRRSVAEIVFVVLTVLIAAGGVFLVARRIRRDTATSG
jgi:hypothetical protein